MGLRINELERLYGIREGSSGKRGLEPNNSAPTQSDIATRMKMSVDTLQNYKLLTEMIPELEELLDTGIVTKTTVLAVMKQQPTSSVPRTTRRKSVKSQRSM